MKMIVQGIMTAQLPWTLVAIGVALAVFCYLVDLPVLAVAIGIYLPLGLTSAVFAGGLIRSLVERASRRDGVVDDTAVDKGVLLASGMVAGDALIGIVIGLFAAIGFKIGFGQVLFPAIAKSSLLSLAMFLLLAGWMFWYSRSRDKTV
jgi:uncharacterized oligopeptide transporter (OPT) family protein